MDKIDIEIAEVERDIENYKDYLRNADHGTYLGVMYASISLKRAYTKLNKLKIKKYGD